MGQGREGVSQGGGRRRSMAGQAVPAPAAAWNSKRAPTIAVLAPDIGIAIDCSTGRGESHGGGVWRGLEGVRQWVGKMTLGWAPPAQRQACAAVPCPGKSVQNPHRCR